ncbi:MAG TPA: hypothetical protein ENK18_18255 [Deltaproteobacteria bacterium]|nr:hypothetical protein [Deltaproteobacteria bacterium]
MLAGGWLVAQGLGQRPPSGASSGAFLGASALGTLIATLEALLPGGADARAVAIDVDAFLAQGDRVLGGQLQLALGVLEHSAALSPLASVRFSRLSVAQRRHVIETWRRSRWGTRRRIADALRRLALFSWYSRPEAWDAIGYDGPWIGRRGP